MIFFILPGYFIFNLFLFIHFVYSDCKFFRTEAVFQHVLDKSMASTYYGTVEVFHTFLVVFEFRIR